MSNFKRVIVEFNNGSHIKRVIVTPDHNVQAIFLDGAEEELVNKPKKKLRESRPGLEVEFREGTTAVDNGDTPCYLVDGELVCWS